MSSISTLKLRDGEYSSIVRCFLPVLFDWWVRVQFRDRAWVNEVVTSAPKDAGAEYYLPHFHRFALEGVLGALQVLAKHWNGEIGWESWTASAPSA